MKKRDRENLQTKITLVLELPTKEQIFLLNVNSHVAEVLNCSSGPKRFFDGCIYWKQNKQ